MRRSPPVRMTRSGIADREARHVGVERLGGDVVGRESRPAATATASSRAACGNLLASAVARARG